MSTQQIPREEWPVFLDSFSKQNEGALASLETLSADAGDQQTETLPFQGISYESRGSDAGAIIIMLGTETDDHLERTISNPTVVQFKPDGEAGPAVLEIEAGDEPTVLLHIAPAIALPTP